MKHIITVLVSLGLAAALVASPAGGGEVTFAKAPAAAAQGGKTVVSFAVSAETDVAAYVLDAKGSVVRHLAAGMLGKNPPAPLKPGLSQSIEWDGKDDVGETARGGPFSVRVAAGMRPKHEGFVFSTPEGKPYNFLGTIRGLAVTPEGSVCAIIYRAYIRATGNFEIQRFTRDGHYDGTLAPFSGHLKPEDVKGYKPCVGGDGRPLPRWMSPSRFRDLPYLPRKPLTQTPIVDEKGRLMMLVGGKGFGLVSVGPDGSVPDVSFGNTFSYDQPLGIWGNQFEVGLARSDADPGTALLTGMKTSAKRKTANLHAVFRVPLAGNGKITPVFGDPNAAGSDEKHLKDPSSVSTDGKGNTYVADTGNNRVVAFEEKSGKFLGSISVPSPHWVGVHRPSGAIYVHSGSEVLKFAGIKAGSAAARLKLPKATAAPIRWRKHLWVFALDSGRKTPRLWIGQCNNPEALRRPASTQLVWCDDLGERFSDIECVRWEPASKMTWSITSDPTHRYVMYKNNILDDRTGEIRMAKGRLGGTPKLGPDGLVYALPSGGNMHRRSLDGKIVPFSGVKAGNWKYRRDEKGQPHAFREMKKGEKAFVGGASMKSEIVEWPGTGQGLPVAPSGTSGCERDFTIDRKGNIYVKNRGRVYHGEMIVDVYDKDGKYLRSAIPSCSDGAYGPRLDAAGNIYMAEGIIRGENNVPPELKSMSQAYALYYASLVKFSPKGGAAWHLSGEEYQKNFSCPPPKLGLKTEKVTMVVNRWIRKDKVLEGAEWWRPGYSVYQNVGSGCHCFGHLFDTDDFGRSFFPDTLRFRMSVVDAAGNEVLHLGGYGNRDNRGPHSWVRDPETKQLRPRKDSDPQDLVSPYAQPEFAFAYLNSVAVTDDHIYALDALNNRVTKIRMNYAADTTVKIR